jgi:glycogen debranching enzyme
MGDRARAEQTINGHHDYEVAGRAASLRLRPAPSISAEAAQDLLTIKHGAIFVCSARDGNIESGVTSGQGMYFQDMRHVSELELTLGGKRMLLLSASAEGGYEAFVELTNPRLRHDAASIEQMTLNVRRRRFISDRVYEQIVVRNHSPGPISTYLELTIDADFADIFEVRGVSYRKSRGQALVPKRSDNVLQFGYLGEDEVLRETLIALETKEDAVTVGDHKRVIRWNLELEPRAMRAIRFTLEPSIAGRRSRRVRPDTAENRVERASEDWRSSSTRFLSVHRSFNRLVDASIRDLGLLQTPIDGRRLIVAGIPWYVAPFGRDALITSYESMLLNAGPARDALLFLAQHQSRADDPLRDAEAGKILHELRVGELAGADYVPHTPYFGTIDATPLFLMLAAGYHRWTGDLETMSRLKPHLDAALEWIDRHGDADGDGFVEYHRRSPAGLLNQGWKDSEDAIVGADGGRVEGPIALVEVQGYVYLAKKRIAEVYEHLGDADRSRALTAEADELKKSFNDAFWMAEEGIFALALDGAKRQVKSVTSNPGHCLYCAIVDDDKAGMVADRLMAEDMFSGWGIRTLSSDSPAYNPMSYHNGSVWPHDNAIVAAGLKRYGFTQATEAIALALLDAAVASRESRLPELFCGFRRRSTSPFVHYPVACRPQAWAAAVPFMILQALLGISANAPEGVLSINDPRLPEWLGKLEVRDLKVGSSQVSLSFSRDDDRTSFSLVGKEGDVRVTLQG